MASGYGGATTGRSMAAILAVLLASPIALGFRAKADAVSPAAARPASTATAVAPLKAASEGIPDEYCASRFLEPIRLLAGDGSAGPPLPILDPAAVGLDAKHGVCEPVASSSVPSAASVWLDHVSEASRSLKRALAAPHRIDVIIATVPDPIDSGLGYFFDTHVEALRLGAEEMRHLRPSPSYYRDRSWLPWDDREPPSQHQTASAECRGSTPGLMLFRGTSAAPGDGALALLLVGETPTTGLHVAAMVNALEAARRITCPDGEGCDDSIAILGPSFSGTASSLRLALQKWSGSGEPTAKHIEIVTGSATGSALPRLLDNKATPWLPAGYDVTFSATTAPDTASKCAYLAFLHYRLGVELDPAVPPSADPTLRGVAFLHESGTEFGASDAARGGRSACRMSPEIDASFPPHISVVRDAYEDLDHRVVASDPAMIHATSLDVSLRENGAPLDMESARSPKTTCAKDIALTTLLEEMAQEGVRHVAIDATDVADAIFLARKIRDVAPDVRLAFFESDALLLHPSLQSDLKGSLVVASYPFLGSDEFARVTHSRHSHLAFENSASIATFNAMLALRGFDASELYEYTFGSTQTALPMWVTAIGESRLVPLAVHPSVDCESTIYQQADAPRAAALAKLCNDDDPKAGWNELNDLSAATLDVDPDVAPPRFWHFLYVAVALGALGDRWLQRRARRLMAGEAMPTRFIAHNDRTADLAIGETKWLLYGAIRSFVFTLALVYMSVHYVFVIVAWGFASFGLSSLVLAGVVVSVWTGRDTFLTGRMFLHRYRAFRTAVTLEYPTLPTSPEQAVRALGATILVALAAAVFLASMRWAPEHTPLVGALLEVFSTVAGTMALAYAWSAWVVFLWPPAPRAGAPEPSAPEEPSHGATDARPAPCPSGPPPSDRWRDFWDWEVISMPIGFGTSRERATVIQTSFAQLRCLVAVSVGLSVAFSVVTFLELFASSDVTEVAFGSVPALTLGVLRNVPLSNGTSMSAPVLLCMACVYAWATGRAARLRLAHGLSRMAPADGLADLVSTPIRVILYPHHPGKQTDSGFTNIERRLLNAIWRPGGLNYFICLLVIVILPIVLFVLKAPSTLEHRLGTWLLCSGLGLCTVLIGATLLQLLQYWLAFETLLKRTMEHPLGRAFRNVGAFARLTVEDQVSRATDDLLQLAGCAQQLGALVTAYESSCHDFLPDDFGNLKAAQCLAEAARVKGLAMATTRDPRGAALAEAELGQRVVEAAREATKLLEKAWNGEIAGEPCAAESTRAGTTEAKEPPEDDTLTAVEGRCSAAQLRWLRQGQSFVATVVAVLIQRHVRQFRYFVYTLTSCALLLLLVLCSYSFEPHRLMLTCIWGITASVVVTGFWIFLELDRNTLLSLISGTEPGKFTLNAALVTRLVTWVVVPLLGVAAALYPQLANVAYRFVEPFARMLK
jgi:hypothetical protein